MNTPVSMILRGTFNKQVTIQDTHTDTETHKPRKEQQQQKLNYLT